MPGSTPAPTPFTPDPAAEYRELCDLLTSLTAYLESEAPELRATGEGAALAELERLAAAMLGRIGEQHAQGAHLVPQGGSHDGL
ncbi:hypothetical protein [Deinococcus murrayi]|uniref:hypothetical protein n=1 Tax=Deinococcus murrayi TaxID=68910 RepID=UPI0004883FA2|nr:hypothetical protein [Deinococcus murrayi]